MLSSSGERSSTLVPSTSTALMSSSSSSPCMLVIAVSLRSRLCNSGQASTGASVVTAVPLVLFAASARRIPLTMLGLLQFLTPTLQFLCGVLVFQEPMSAERWIGFALVWVALMCMSFDALRRLRTGEQLHDSDEAVVAATADLG